MRCKRSRQILCRTVGVDVAFRLRVDDFVHEGAAVASMRMPLLGFVSVELSVRVQPSVLEASVRIVSTSVVHSRYTHFKYSTIVLLSTYIDGQIHLNWPLINVKNCITRAIKTFSTYNSTQNKCRSRNHNHHFNYFQGCFAVEQQIGPQLQVRCVVSAQPQRSWRLFFALFLTF